MVTQKQKRRMYRLHGNLRRKGNIVIARERTVYRRGTELTGKESAWVDELLDFGYGVMDWLFTTSPYTEE